MTWVISSDLEGYYFILFCYILDLNKGMLAILVKCNILWANLMQVLSFVSTNPINDSLSAKNRQGTPLLLS